MSLNKSKLLSLKDQLAEDEKAETLKDVQVELKEDKKRIKK